MRRVGVGLLVVVVGIVAAAGAWAVHRMSVRQAEHGRALFRGDVVLAGRLAGHSQTLPTAAVRCINCHEMPSVTPAVSPSPTGKPAVAARPYAGGLDASSLTEPRSRRGGPASRYDEAALCVLLRTGVDPALILLPPTMPRYEVAPQDCSDLWAYLSRRGDTP